MLTFRTLNRQEAWEMWQEGFPEDREDFFRLFWEKRSDRRESFGLYDEGQLVSALHLIPQKLRIREAAVDAVMVAGVATRQDARHRGYASVLMREAHERIIHAGCPLAFLDPFLEAFYRPFGYETGTGYRDSVFAREGDPGRLSTADKTDAQEIYAESIMGTGVSVLRSQTDWVFRNADLALENGAVWKDNKSRSYLMLTEEEDCVLIFEHQTAPGSLQDVMEAVCALYHKPVICPVPVKPGEKGFRHGAMFAPLLIGDLIGKIPREEGEIRFRLGTPQGVRLVRLTPRECSIEESDGEAQITDVQLFLLMIGADVRGMCDENVLKELRRIYPARRGIVWEQY